jgi:hypothetical protein
MNVWWKPKWGHHIKNCGGGGAHWSRPVSGRCSLRISDDARISWDILVVILCPSSEIPSCYTVWGHECFLPNAVRFIIHHFLLFLVGWGWVSWYCGHYWCVVRAPGDRWGWLWRNCWNEDWQGNPKYSEKSCPSATLFTTNPTWLLAYCTSPGW